MRDNTRNTKQNRNSKVASTKKRTTKHLDPATELRRIFGQSEEFEFSEPIIEASTPEPKTVRVSSQKRVRPWARPRTTVSIRQEKLQNQTTSSPSRTPLQPISTPNQTNPKTTPKSIEPLPGFAFLTAGILSKPHQWLPQDADVDMVRDKVTESRLLPGADVLPQYKFNEPPRKEEGQSAVQNFPGKCSIVYLLNNDNNQQQHRAMETDPMKNYTPSQTPQSKNHFYGNLREPLSCTPDSDQFLKTFNSFPKSTGYDNEINTKGNGYGLLTNNSLVDMSQVSNLSNNLSNLDQSTYSKIDSFTKSSFHEPMSITSRQAAS
ncbi:hypothetical protein KGF56_000289 [Candida oxycetoniae]|uniref:Uncharacterized protein n=1 Tax=Candida oxycetoniae TaxID=497107 RepID=A0AAI9T180_9ASCO|nr:uncharacterized protein KGF56_000289 [Candida oxycetoniae]KAI3406996.2 hypothetical protein KGF56_000289 [Candida oxycetoniae]